MQVPTQNIHLKEDLHLDVRREDLLHPHISGNKYRKLKYNIAFALARRTGGKAKNYKTLLTYGGAFSNHIAATAAAGKEAGLKTIGIIRGEELGVDLPKTLQQNKTLAFAVSQGMQLKFVSRSTYREKGTAGFRDLSAGKEESVLNAFKPFYELPEGGTNALAVKGCMEILTEEDAKYDYICCAAGTGGTAAGIIEASLPHQTVLVFPALKGDFLREEIIKYTQKSNWRLITEYHFGGYAKVNDTLITFINTFRKKNGVPLDPIYTGKMIYGIMDLIKKGFFSKNTRILAVHTGGLQGIAGMNARLRAKNAPALIDIDG